MGVTLPDRLGATSDPFELLHYAAQISEEVAVATERELTRLEVEAVVATPTPFAHDVIREAAGRDGGSVAIVSNNSVAANDVYPRTPGLQAHVSGIYARTPAATPLEPSPHLLEAALAGLRTETRTACLAISSARERQAVSGRR